MKMSLYLRTSFKMPCVRPLESARRGPLFLKYKLGLTISFHAETMLSM